MVENDIYDNKRKYEDFKKNLHLMSLPPAERNNPRIKYYCKNKINLVYFDKLFPVFEAKDLSYVRRVRLLQKLKMIVYTTENDLALCDREDINKIAAFMHTTCDSPKSKQDFIRDTKYMWKLLFPEKDEKGRADETIMPYVCFEYETFSGVIP